MQPHVPVAIHTAYQRKQQQRRHTRQQQEPCCRRRRPARLSPRQPLPEAPPEQHHPEPGQHRVDHEQRLAVVRREQQRHRNRGRRTVRIPQRARHRFTRDHADDSHSQQHQRREFSRGRHQQHRHTDGVQHLQQQVLRYRRHEQQVAQHNHRPAYQQVARDLSVRHVGSLLRRHAQGQGRPRQEHERGRAQMRHPAREKLRKRQRRAHHVAQRRVVGDAPAVEVHGRVVDGHQHHHQATQPVDRSESRRHGGFLSPRGRNHQRSSQARGHKSW